MNKIICKKCGGEISNDFGVTLTFCTHCGASIKNLHEERPVILDDVPTLVSPTPANYNSPSNSKMTRNVVGCLGLGFGAVLLSAVGIFGYWYWSVKDSTNPDYYGKIILPKSQVVRYMTGSTRDFKSLDPHLSGSDEIVITNALFDGLTEYNNKNVDLTPSLATSWETNADATVWTFYLRREAKWTDGKPVTAQDFVYSWRRTLNPDLKLSADVFYVIKNAESYYKKTAKLEDVGIRAVDDYTLQVTMEKPTPFFVKMTAMHYFRPIPQQAVEKFGADWAKPGNIVSSGAFKLTEWSPKNQIVLERNAQFWDNANTKLERIVFPSPERVSLDKFDPVQWYKNGEIDVSSSMISDDESFRDKKDFLRVNSLGTLFLGVNTTVAPLTDARVRRALSLAIDREKLKEKDLGFLPAFSFIPEIKGYENAKNQGFNPDEARKLLAEAGFAGGSKFPEIEYIYNTSASNHKIAEFIRQQWEKELGIKVKLVNMEFKEFLKKRSALDYKGLMRGGWIADYADPYNFLVLLSDEKNPSGWKDKKYDEMLEKANAETDETKRYKMLSEAETYLLEQQPVIPLTLSRTGILCKPFIKNLVPNPLGNINWREVYIDQNWTAK